MTDQPSLKAAARILADRDPVIDRLLFLTGPPELAPPVEGNFAALVRAIVYQQLAGRAAAAIHCLAWQVPTPTARELQPLGDPFRPYRSVAAWYCWRAAELYAGPADSALTR